MGLGKTIQSIAFLAYLREVENIKGPHLIVAPLSVVENWKQEISKWFPDCKVHTISAIKSDRSNTRRTIDRDDYNILITSYEGLTKNLGSLELKRFVYFILDEAHKIKNEKSQFSEVARKVPSEYRLLLTGTPLSNNTAELWSLLNFIMPNIFDTKSIIEELFSKKQDHESQEEMLTQTELVESIHKIIRPFMLRRLKQDTNIVLKPKKEVHVYCPMSQLQRELYKDIIMSKREGDKLTLSNIIMQLRKASIHPYLFPHLDTEAEAIGMHLIHNSGKFIILDKMIEKFVLKVAASNLGRKENSYLQPVHGCARHPRRLPHAQTDPVFQAGWTDACQRPKRVHEEVQPRGSSDQSLHFVDSSRRSGHQPDGGIDRHHLGQ